MRIKGHPAFEVGFRPATFQCLLQCVYRRAASPRTLCVQVPVYKGAAQSLLGKVSHFDNFSGPAWSVPVDLSRLQSEHAANALVRFVNQFPG